MGLSVIYVLILAKMLDANSLGVYYLTMTMMSFLMVVSRLGFDTLILKTTSILISERNLIALKKLQGYVSKKILLLSILVIITTFSIANHIAEVFFDGANNYGLLIVSSTLYFYNMVFIYSETLKGYNCLNLSVCLPNVLFPALNLIALSVLFPFFGEISVFYAVSISVIIVYLISLIIVKNQFEKYTHTPNIKNEHQPLAIPYSFYFIALSNYIFAFIDTLTLGVFSSNADVGIYSVLLRLVLPFSVLLIIINNVFSRKFSIWYENKQLGKCIDTYKLLIKYSLLFATVYFAIILNFGDDMLLFFGNDYLMGKTALIIISFGYFILLVTGPSAAVLMMCGHEKQYKNIVVCTGILGVMLSCILTYLFGLIGAAISTTISLIIKNLVSFYLASTCLGVKFRG
ncbi:flippase [Colwellia sp. KU-HH00111]